MRTITIHSEADNFFGLGLPLDSDTKDPLKPLAHVREDAKPTSRGTEEQIIDLDADQAVMHALLDEPLRRGYINATGAELLHSGRQALIE